MSKVGQIHYIDGQEVVLSPGQFKADQQLQSIRLGMLGSRSTSSAISVAPAATLNTQPTISEVTRNTSTVGQAIPLVYGHAQVAGKPFAIDYTDGVWTVGYVVCLGEIESIVKVLMDDELPAAGVTINEYLGTTSQTADPLLAAAITDYDDNLVITRGGESMGIAYIVAQFSVEDYADWPRVVVEVEGRKVFNPKTSLTEYSENPALQLGDLLSSTWYGHGYTVDATSLEAAQDYCDDATPGEVRRTGFAVMDSASETDTAVDYLRTYAGCFVSYRGDTARLIPDKSESSVRSFTADDILRGSLKIRKADSANVPTVVRVIYTDKTGDVWRDRMSDEAFVSGVELGTVPRRVSTVRLPGVSRHSQAYREAVERLNKLRLSDLSITFTTFDEALALEVGDVITVTHPYGLTNKLFRITSEPVQESPGRWSISASEYDPASYSDAIASQPSFADGNLPSGTVPEAVTGLSVSETTYQVQNGRYVSRLDISWNASSDIFLAGYTLTVLGASNEVVYTTNTQSTSAATPPLQELVNYTVKVAAYTPTATGAESQANFTIIGKTAIPNPPATITGFEVGGEVRLQWSASDDVDAERYEIRYGDTTGTWDTATVIDQTDSLRLNSRDVPPSETATGGVWRFYVKTIDSIKQYSSTAATVDFSVTQDNDAFTAGNVNPITTHASLTSVHETVEVRGGGAVYYSDGGDTWSDLFGAAAMSTFTNPLASYQTTGTSTWLSEELALSADRTGNFIGSPPTLTDLSGTATTELGVKPDGGSYTYGDLAQKTTARYAQVRVQSAGVFKLELPSGFIRADVAAQTEEGSATSAASGATTITLDNAYAGVRSITLTPQATASRVAVFDNVVLGATTSFDVYIFDSAGNQVVTPFQYQFKGV